MDHAQSEKQSGTQRSIKNTWLRRNATLASITLLRRFLPSQWGVLMLPLGLCVKYGRSRHVSEAETMEYVAAHTSVPVPKVYCAFTKRGVTYILMKRIKGTSLRTAWFSCEEEEKDELRRQLRLILKDLRSLAPPQPGQVAAIDYSELFDDRINAHGFGPFPTCKEFHEFLRNGIVKPVADPELDQLITEQDEKAYSTCLTHGDLNSFNILVRKGSVVGIIDWEMAGWFPEYWEYTSAWHVNPYDEWWRPEISNILDAYPAELAMERTRRKRFTIF